MLVGFLLGVSLYLRRNIDQFELLQTKDIGIIDQIRQLQADHPEWGQDEIILELTNQRS